MTRLVDCTLTVERVDVYWDEPAPLESSRALAEDIGRRLVERLSQLQQRRAEAIVAGRAEPGRIDLARVAVHLGGARSPNPAAIADAIARSLARRLT